ncbi:amylo-alpha-1,6-glucosidase [Candidatus Mycobacterium methanotrophicum]|uniref:Amylo-alpha-1,6-glucosidase n=2 Tax=Candidatus Mycobacterium methanotrophicum TaxID=2943498 RepID=A0ABY4QPC6_9MYCO|nr:amylo-alpha-1,6-glucosidase [Candidatus Mycobacterium methanotrophicum]UQX12860.1 amylo-alpha-1,6-glucosidase [Candidatus Mycobacterium methanotrophicum]
MPPGRWPTCSPGGYHGLLVAALSPPLGRTVMLVKTDATLTYRGSSYDLFANRWSDGAVAPAGHRLIERFWLDGTIPVWRFACGDALVEQRIWMEPGADTTYVQYRMAAARESAIIGIKAIVDYRDFHGRTGAGQWETSYEMIDQGVRIVAFPGARPLILRASAGDISIANHWYYGFELARERGLADREDHLHAVTAHAEVKPGENFILVASTDDAARPDATALDRRRGYETGLLDTWSATRPDNESPPAWVRQLVLAADQFIVARPTDMGTDGRTVIAGYHWFGDWSRDTMISLPGLTLATGRATIAKNILQTFAGCISQGMLPNRFPDRAETVMYNTVDATLWYFEAIRAYYESTGDNNFLNGIFPILDDIITQHLRGTRYRIKVDEADGLLYAGQPGVQLTWMDAIVDGQVVTARIGKPVEVNALWYNALVSMARFAVRLGRPVARYQDLAARALAGFERFWNPGMGYCFDVLDGPAGNEDRLRPNQILAVSLPASPLPPDRQRGVVDACERFLLTSAGLRSLDSSDPDYRGTYCGDQFHRDSAYHQGTVWGWLLGPFIQAHLRVYHDVDRAESFLWPYIDLVRAMGLGSLSEIAEGDPPMRPVGCIAQAWSVAEALRAWDLVQRAHRAGLTSSPNSVQT